ncbi:MAG: hypothetical protein MMC23_007658 [Stictis urceolatum]|nr:hypothetical protein [Stictis urceolata]
MDVGPDSGVDDEAMMVLPLLPLLLLTSILLASGPSFRGHSGVAMEHSLAKGPMANASSKGSVRSEAALGGIWVREGGFLEGRDGPMDKVGQKEACLLEPLGCLATGEV